MHAQCRSISLVLVCMNAFVKLQDPLRKSLLRGAEKHDTTVGSRTSPGQQSAVDQFAHHSDLWPTLLPVALARALSLSTLLSTQKEPQHCEFHGRQAM